MLDKGKSQSETSGVLFWVFPSLLIGAAFTVGFWVHTLSYNVFAADAGDRAVLLFFYGLLFMLAATAIGLLVVLTVRIVPLLRRPWLRTLPAVLGFASFLGFVHLYTHGIYYHEFGIESPYVALALKIVQVALVGLLVLAAALVSTATFTVLARSGNLRTVAFLVFGGAVVFGFAFPQPCTSLYEENLPPLAAGVSRSVIVLGIDAATWRVIDPLIEDGRLPNFERLKREGSWGGVKPFKPTNSPEIWTSIVTGEPPHRHGILGHVTFRFRGMEGEMCFPHYTGMNFGLGALMERFGLVERNPVPSTMRRAPALWDIATAYGLRSSVIDWFATFPPESISGVVVSDLFDTAHRRHASDSRDLMAEELADLIEPPSALSYLLQDGPLPTNGDDLNFRVMQILQREASPDMVFVWFAEPDSVQHTRWKYFEPEKFFGVSPEEVELFGDSIPAAYEQKDRMIGEVLDSMSADTLLVVCSDHGGGPVFGEMRHSGGHVNEPEGILIFRGPGVKAGYRINEASVFDILPTICYLRGIPVAEVWAGSVLTELVDNELGTTLPLLTVEGYQMPQVRYRDSSVEVELGVNEDAMERLKALGYIK